MGGHGDGEFLFTTMPITCHHCGKDCTSLPGGQCDCDQAKADRENPRTDKKQFDVPDLLFTTMPITCHFCGQDCTSLPGGQCNCPAAKAQREK
ncbi:MAG TPA: hypothetical protein V6C81_18275 [Planktothrix sp.]|jgi:hypothetical protein